MTHSSLQSLGVLLEHAERERDQARVRLQRAELALNNAQTQAEQLQQYRTESDQRWNAQARQGISIALLQCHQQFSGRLHGAVGQQDQQLARLQADQQRRQAELLACELRVASVRKLLERRSGVLQQQAERSEQKQLDERSSRATWQRQADLSAAGSA
ncbi:MAG: flagellar export protein FliJ [Leptothrix sp. (in: b-proteobacteria)]